MVVLRLQPARLGPAEVWWGLQSFVGFCSGLLACAGVCRVLLGCAGVC